ncbi:hypothetical protein B9T25_14250 [Acinetobacter sp. ANC 4470]|uniref:type II toxin-antitoxin system HipA family toxin n=1 Tax=Acinetobacter sp. ANC 4470 TaxID=1977881 RepID=UPI000A335D6D|nr:type II toxin-antitoxin system HipA family toxin [Acinetobacter sp. ANC 4470]OTG62960.1 hypothetical protein B9T25_14250 [Acinetobacter sp. ANC 4470]
MENLYKIDVYYCGWGENWCLGKIASNGRQTVFQYSDEALQRNIEFSPRYLPLQRNAFTNFPPFQYQLPGLFADSLPDGWGLLLMDRFFKKEFEKNRDQINPLERLACLGEQTMGAFIYLPASEKTTEIKEMSLFEIAKTMEAVQIGLDVNVLETLVLMGGSPQGARPKAQVYYNPLNGDMSNCPIVGGEPWLVKFNARSEDVEVCAIEKFYLDTAALCGLAVPESRIFHINADIAAIGMKRFDRLNEIRIPMHSLASALHTDFRIPNCSYEIFLRMTRFMTKNEKEVEKAFSYCVFNVCMNNRDDHTKNFSYLMSQNGEWALSPAYDLTFNTGMNGHHQMDVEGETYRITRQHLLSLAKNSGLDLNKSEVLLDHIVGIARNRIDDLFNGQYAISKETVSLIKTKVEENIKLLDS